MKRILGLLLAMMAGSALGSPARSWVEIQYGELEREQAIPRAIDEEGTYSAFSAAYASSSTTYWRLDVRRLEHESTLEPYVIGDEPVPGLAVTADTVFEPDAWQHVAERNIETLSVGVRSPMNSGVDLIGELGVARLRDTNPFVAVTSAPGGSEVLAYGHQSFETEETGGVGRLGLIAEDGAVGWGGTMEWYSKVPTGVPGETDSMRWWNAYIGWRITPNWTLSANYADYDAFTSKGISLRWTR